MKAIKSVKEAFENNNVLITKVTKGLNGYVRIDARTRHREADKDNFFSKWVKRGYANRLCNDCFDKDLEDLSVYYS